MTSAPATEPSDRWLGKALRALLALVLVVGLDASGLLDSLHRQILDLRFALLQRPVSGGITVVEIDAASLKALDTWPWPREYHAELIDRLFAAGAKRVAFDVDFSSRSNERSDARFEAALAAHDHAVTLPIFEQYRTGPDGDELVLSEPLPRFRRHVNLASVNVFPDEDALVRVMAPTTRIGATEIPALSTSLTGKPPATDEPYLIDFGIDASGITRISYADILRGSFDPALIRGRSILIGATAIELSDILPVPRYTVLPGVLVHALAYESLAQGRAILPWGGPARLVLAAVVVLLLSWPMANLRWRRALAVCLGVGLLLVAAMVFVQAHLVVDFDESPALAGTLALFIVSILRRVDLQVVLLRRQRIQFDRVDALMNKIVEASLDGIVTFRDDGRIETANDAAVRMFAELVGAELQGILPELAGRIEALPGRMIAGRGHVEFQARRLDGRQFPVEVSTSEVADGAARTNVAVINDITDRKRYEAELQKRALYDELTGLANRALLRDRLEKAIHHARRLGLPFAVLLLDLDRFKEVNDTLGHGVGDVLLNDAAKRLLGLVRESDTVARFGGDEFVLLLPAVTELETARHVAERVVAGLAEPFVLGEMNLEIGASVGIATFPAHAETADDLIKCADVAMYMAKSGNRQIALYDRELDRHSVRSLALTGELRHAIENDQLVLAYQPKVDLATGEVFGFEALVRWIHPVHGFVPPDDFINHAERTGIIGELTRWGLRTALSQLGQWRGSGYDFTVAVNLSTANLTDPSLPALVKSLIAENAIPPEKVTLEITENALMSDPEQALRTVSTLRDLGVRLSIDDFGTGYSSLGYLKDLPVHELKIDKSFVTPMTEDEGDQVIVRTTIELAHNLGLKVVAEGVEDASHVEMLRSMGCDTGQGYHIAKPLQPAQLAEWLAEGTWPARRLPSAGQAEGERTAA